MDNLEGALDSVKRGLGIDSSNADLKKMSRELEEAMRLKRVDAAIASAEAQIKAGDYNSAFKTIEGGQRLDPKNAALSRLMDRVKPHYERGEKHRIASLDPRERIKEEGDTFFKAANFEKAIHSYTRCIDSSPDKVCIFVIDKFYSVRLLYFHF